MWVKVIAWETLKGEHIRFKEPNPKNKIITLLKIIEIIKNITNLSLEPMEIQIKSNNIEHPLKDRKQTKDLSKRETTKGIIRLVTRQTTRVRPVVL